MSEKTIQLNAQIDEKYYPLSDAEQRRKAEGTRPRGLSRNQICIAVGCDDGGRSFFSRLGLGKPSEARTRAAYAGHIQEGSHLVHDMERTHRVLVDELSLTDEAHNSKLIRALPDGENPLREANRLCFLLELFPNSHSGFDRSRLEGYLDLFYVMMNDPGGRWRRRLSCSIAQCVSRIRSDTGNTTERRPAQRESAAPRNPQSANQDL